MSDNISMNSQSIVSCAYFEWDDDQGKLRIMCNHCTDEDHVFFFDFPERSENVDWIAALAAHLQAEHPRYIL